MEKYLASIRRRAYVILFLTTSSKCGGRIYRLRRLNEKHKLLFSQNKHRLPEKSKERENKNEEKTPHEDPFFRT